MTYRNRMFLEHAYRKTAPAHLDYIYMNASTMFCQIRLEVLWEDKEPETLGDSAERKRKNVYDDMPSNKALRKQARIVRLDQLTNTLDEHKEKLVGLIEQAKQLNTLIPARHVLDAEERVAETYKLLAMGTRLNMVYRLNDALSKICKSIHVLKVMIRAASINVWLSEPASIRYKASTMPWPRSARASMC